MALYKVFVAREVAVKDLKRWRGAARFPGRESCYALQFPKMHTKPEMHAVIGHVVTELGIKDVFWNEPLRAFIVPIPVFGPDGEVLKLQQVGDHILAELGVDASWEPALVSRETIHTFGI